MKNRVVEILRGYLIASIWVYFTILFVWVAAYFITGDRYPVMALLNSAGLYLFAPLPLVLPIAIVTRRRELLLGLAIGVGLFTLLWGSLFLPRAMSSSEGELTLTVMNYNVYADKRDPSPVIEIIRASNADVVFLQEVTTGLEKAIEDELGSQYPYQAIDAHDNATGMGTISKYPLRESGETLPLQWVGEPQVLILDWHGQEVKLINFHMWAIGLRPLKYVGLNYRAREAQALFLADFARIMAREHPLIVSGDANVTDRSDAYRLISDVLIDSWRESGFGFGHTYPGAAGFRLPGLRWHLPRWLFRIDYIFHSNHWQAVDARLADSDGGSDHRAVVADLVFRESDSAETGQMTLE